MVNALGRLGGSGHDLTVHEVKPGIGLCADSSGPEACFGFWVSLALCPSPACSLSLSKTLKIIMNNKIKKRAEITAKSEPEPGLLTQAWLPHNGGA